MSRYPTSRHLLLCSAAMIAGLGALAPQAARAEEEFTLLDTVTLYARQTLESLADVPVSASVTDGEDLQRRGVGDLEDLAQNVAGYEQPNYGDDPRTALPIIRGIGALSTLLSPDNATTTILLDGVPLPAFAATSQMLDLQQVDILRGPQGTLFGRSSTAGAVVMQSVVPDGTPGGRLGIEAGSGGHAKIEAEGGMRLGENLAGRAALRFTTQDGYIKNDHPGQEDVGGADVGAFRGALAWTPSDATTVTLSLGYERDDRGSGYPFALRDSNLWQETPQFDRKLGHATLNVETDLGWGRFYSVTGVLRYGIDNFTDNTDGYLFGALVGVPNAFFTDDAQYNLSDQSETQLYQEFRLQSAEGAATRWVAGLALTQNDYTEDAFGVSMIFPTNNGTRHVELGSRSVAVFGDVVTPLSDRLEFGAGLRFTHEEKSIDHSFAGNGFVGTVADYAQSSDRNFDLLTGHVTLSYRPTDESMIFGRIARSGKAGGYPRFTNNASYGVAETGYDAAQGWSSELGYKTALMDGRGFIQASAFYNDIKNEAFFAYDAVTNTFPIQNMDVRSYGVELDSSFQMTDTLRLGVGAAWTRATIAGIETGSSFASTVGNDVPNVPRLSTMLSLDYAAPVSFTGNDDAMLNASVMWRHVDARPADAGNNFDLKQQDILNARVAVEWGNKELYIFGTNLLDDPMEQQGAQLAPGVESVLVGKGRTVGLGLNLTF